MRCDPLTCLWTTGKRDAGLPMKAALFLGGLLLSTGLLAGCSSGRSGERAAGIGPRNTEAGLPMATTAANLSADEPGHRTIRPIPEVIARPRPFRVPVASAAADLATGPATMRPIIAAAEAARKMPHRFVASNEATTAAERPAAPLPASVRPVAVAPPRVPATPAAAAELRATNAAAPAVAEIRGMMRDYLRAFNRHDPAAVAAHWAAAAESVDLVSGEVTAGRDAVRDVFASLFEQDASATIDIDVTSVRPVRDDVAVVDGVTRLTCVDGAPSASRFSAVMVKEGGRWMLESVRETAQPAAAAPRPRPLDELAWLLGAWEDAGEGVTASTQCFWSAGRGFIVRSHVVGATPAPENVPASGDDRIPGLLPPGGSEPRELTEIIGWDPDRQELRSWVFTSGGRFAEGVWTRDGETWTVQFTGHGRDEGSGCRCTLSRVGADGLTVRCDTDALADLLPPACDFVRTARRLE